MFNLLEPAELRLGGILAAVVGLRMLGLFLVLPVFMLLAMDTPGYTPTLAGLAIGIYGLTQAAMQQPFGRLSDRWGRRRVIWLGLALFVAGGVVAALANGMALLIAGRALQGCGAIAGVTLAFAADHTHPQRQPVIMALIGIGIGASFLVSIMLSVPLAAVLGLSGLFWLTSVLGVLAMLMVAATPGHGPARADFPPTSEVNGDIRPLAASVFLLHALMTLFFVVLPGMLVADYALALPQHWKIYVPTMALSAICVFPLLHALGRRGQERDVLPWAFAALALVFALIGHSGGVWMLMAVVTLYFLAFNVLEAAMPSLVSRLAGPHGRGHRMGVYTTFQFLGAFCGGAGGGWLLERMGPAQLLTAAAGVCLAWAVIYRWLPVTRPAR